MVGGVEELGSRDAGDGGRGWYGPGTGVSRFHLIDLLPKLHFEIHWGCALFTYTFQSNFEILRFILEMKSVSFMNPAMKQKTPSMNNIVFSSLIFTLETNAVFNID